MFKLKVYFIFSPNYIIYTQFLQLKLQNEFSKKITVKLLTVIIIKYFKLFYTLLSYFHTPSHKFHSQLHKFLQFFPSIFSPVLKY